MENRIESIGVNEQTPREIVEELDRYIVGQDEAKRSVAIALRYIPDIQRDYHSISQAQQARGVELGKKEPLFTRMKNAAGILLPLILSSLARIDVISNAMELRGFGKNKKRTWYRRRPFARNDYLALALGVFLLALSIVITFHDGNRFYNPFI